MNPTDPIEVFQALKMMTLDELETMQKELREYRSKPDASKFVIEKRERLLTLLFAFCDAADPALNLQFVKGLDKGRADVNPDRFRGFAKDHERIRTYRAMYVMKHFPNLF